MPKILKKKKKVLIILSLILLCALCLSGAFLLSDYLITTNIETTMIGSQSIEIYFLSLTKSQVKSEASSFCSNWQSENSAGYVWQKDDYYHVVDSAYINKNDALLMQNSFKLNEVQTEIFSVKFPSYMINANFSNENSKIFSKAINSFLEYYKDIFDIAVSVDTNVYNEISARMAVNSAHNKFVTTIDNFNLVFNDEKSEIKSLSYSLDKAKQVSTKLCTALPLNSSQTYSSLLKYRYLEILQIYFEYLN